MNTLKYALILLLLAAPYQAIAGGYIKSNNTTVQEAQIQELHHISMLNLIVDPSKYDAKRVMVRGFVYLDFDLPALYLSIESRRNGVTKESVNLISLYQVNEDGSILEEYEIPEDIDAKIKSDGFAFVSVRGLFMDNVITSGQVARAGSVIIENINLAHRGVDLN